MSLNPAGMTEEPRGRQLRIADAHEPPPLIDDPDLADPARLVIAARDAQGESEVLTLKLPPLFMEELRQVARDEGWPWRDVQAVVRWCVSFGLHKIERAKAPESSFLWMVDAMNEYLRHDEYRHVFEQHFTLMGETVRWYQANDPTGAGVRVMAAAIYGKILAGPVAGDDGWWRDRAIERFLLLYGDYL